MPRNLIPAEEYVYDRAALLAYYSSGADNSKDRHKMMDLLMKTVHNELTNQQRYCLVEHYLHGRKMKDIAASLNINPSCVSRHIQRAKKRIKHITDYYKS